MSEAKRYPRAYVRDGVPGLTMAKQEEILTAAGIDISDAYRDMLKKAQIKRRSPDELRDRARMMRPTSRGTPEIIYVASLRCLGWTMADIARAIAAAGRRNASIHAVDIAETFNAETIPERLMLALANADDARRIGQTADGRSAGVTAAAIKKEKKRKAQLAIAAPLWVLPSGEISATEIANQVKMSVRSLHKWLGPRQEARDAITKGKKHL